MTEITRGWIIRWTDKYSHDTGYGDFRFYPNEKGFAIRVAKEMDEKFPNYDHIVVNITPEILMVIKNEQR